MLRLCSKSSRSYQGRPVRHAVRILTASDAAMYRVNGQESAAVILGAGETSRTKVRRSHPAEGLNIHYSHQAVPDTTSFVKRPVRTRKPWCCGEGEKETPPYPIRYYILVPLFYAALAIPRGAGAPRKRPRVLRSSSMSGQWIPYPAPAMRQFARCSDVACSRRGYHAKGTVMVRPSKRSTLIASSVTRTSLTRSPALGSKVVIPCLQ